MANDWILDVLLDLKCFAQKNGLRALSEQLDDTADVAANELRQMQSAMPGAAKEYSRE